MASMRLSNEQWQLIQQLLSDSYRKNGRGRPRRNDRIILEGILFVKQSGCSWRTLPAHYGSATTCWRRYQEWSAQGMWRRILDLLTGAPIS